MKRSLKLASMNLRVGVFVALAGLAILMVLFTPIRGVSPASRKITLKAYFNDAGGLKRNSPVYLTGMEVGKVDSVEFTPPGSPYRLEVNITVERKVQHLLRGDTVMKIAPKGLLGDMFVELTPGDPALPMVTGGQTLPGADPQGMLASLEPLKERVEAILEKADTLLGLAQSRQSSVGSLFVERQLYDELVAAVKNIRDASGELAQISKNVNEKLLDKNTKEGVDEAVASVKRITTRMDAYTQKIEGIRWYLDVSGAKYEATQFETAAKLRIVPNPDRYYMGGIANFNTLGPHTGEENITYDAALGFRILSTPIFFWGGMKRTFFAAGLDLRLFDERIGLSADAYKFGRETVQMDLAARYRFFNVFSLTGGADDVLTTPRYKGGLMFTYDDQDLTAILIKLQTGL